MEHMLAYLSLFVSCLDHCLLVLAEAWPHICFLDLLICSRLYRPIGLSFFVLMRSASSFGICQGCLGST